MSGAAESIFRPCRIGQVRDGAEGSNPASSVQFPELAPEGGAAGGELRKPAIGIR
jgi:hypothetical protein